MKLQLIKGVAGDRNPSRLKPVDHFKKCPACGGDDLIEVNPDVLCSRCDWASMAWDVSRGGMDSLMVAAREFGFPIAVPIESSGLRPKQADELALNMEGA